LFLLMALFPFFCLIYFERFIITKLRKAAPFFFILFTGNLRLYLLKAI